MNQDQDSFLFIPHPSSLIPHPCRESPLGMIVTDLSMNARQNPAPGRDSPSKRSDHTQFIQNKQKSEGFSGNRIPLPKKSDVPRSLPPAISACLGPVCSVQFYQAAKCCPR